MLPVKQTADDCFRACVASIFELPLSAVPQALVAVGLDPARGHCITDDLPEGEMWDAIYFGDLALAYGKESAKGMASTSGYRAPR